MWDVSSPGGEETGTLRQALPGSGAGGTHASITQTQSGPGIGTGTANSTGTRAFSSPGAACRRPRLRGRREAWGSPLVSFPGLSPLLGASTTRLPGVSVHRASAAFVRQHEPVPRRPIGPAQRRHLSTPGDRGVTGGSLRPTCLSHGLRVRLAGQRLVTSQDQALPGPLAARSLHLQPGSLRSAIRRGASWSPHPTAGQHGPRTPTTAPRTPTSTVSREGLRAGGAGERRGRAAGRPALYGF